ncbi:MAG: hypothetical protein ACKO1M_11905 [Planctomycetota bacterium]
MRAGFVAAVVAVLATALRAGAAGPSCTGGNAACEPRCRATWEDKKTKETDYEIRCEYACARARDPWHAPEPECRCQPPCGAVYVKKRLYKSEGKETSERVPKYEVDLVSPRSCGCASCASGRTHGWDPLGILTFLHRR